MLRSLYTRVFLFAILTLFIGLQSHLVKANYEVSPLDKLPSEQLRRYAEADDAEAQFILGARYKIGSEDVERNISQADMWFQRALPALQKKAEAGDSSAQYYLGVIYNFGHGVAIDNDKATTWYKKAAEQGKRRPVEMLWMMYNGHPSLETFQWFQEMADRGNAQAKLFLGIAYIDGKFVPTNDIISYMWFALAARDGEKSAADGRDARAENMTPEQMEEAERLADEWQAEFSKN